MLLSANDKLYGLHQSYINSRDYATLFSYEPLTVIYADLYNFPDGTSETQHITQGSNGKFYIPFQLAGGVGHTGNLYEYNPVNNTATLVHNFIDASGSFPGGGLTELTTGIFYHSKNT